MADFIITTDGLDRHGGRILPLGVDVSAFEKNPVMLNGHWGDVVGRWENLQLSADGRQMTATAIFDETGQEGAEIARKVNDGFLNACSVGVRVLEWSEDPNLMLQGQRWETITKCELLEVSIVDVPANPDAIVLRRSISNQQSQDIKVTKDTKFQAGDILHFSYNVNMKEDKKTAEIKTTAPVAAQEGEVKTVEQTEAEKSTEADKVGILVAKSLATVEARNAEIKADFDSLKKSFDELQADKDAQNQTILKQSETIETLQKSVKELATVIASITGKPTTEKDNGGINISKTNKAINDKLATTKAFLDERVAGGFMSRKEADRVLANYSKI